MSAAELLVRGATILDPDGPLRVADIRATGGLITEVGPGLRPGSARVVEAEGMVATPGLINAHTHSGQNLDRGMAPNLPLDLWDLFPDRLVDSELGEIPEGWEVKALGEVIELAYGKALKAGDRKGGDVPVYGSNGQVGWHNKKLVDGPGIIVGRKGNPGIVTWAHSRFFPIDTAFYVIAKSPAMSPNFLYYALIDQDLPSVSADSAVPGLNRNLAYMNNQLVPDETVLAAFGEQVAELFRRRYRLEAESRALAAQRDALLPKLISGEMGLDTSTPPRGS